MDGLFPPVDPEPGRGRRRGRLVPFTAVLPNVVTLLGLCSGLTAIRMAVEHRFDLAVAAIVFAVILDGLDGRLARYFRATSKFGEQLDSLADFVDFGVAPAILLYTWRLDELSSFGWICALVLAICTGLRLARFNSDLASDEPRPDWYRDFFVGVPAPAGAIAVLLPIFLERTGIIELRIAALIVAAYSLIIAILMVSRVPTLSGKRIGRRMPREAVLPVLVVAVLLVAFLASYPFSFLAVATIAYLAHIPFAWRARSRAEARSAELQGAAPVGGESGEQA
jgi:CDP-diacylglycerol--serine O-phosphatidyltransferase